MYAIDTINIIANLTPEHKRFFFKIPQKHRVFGDFFDLVMDSNKSTKTGIKDGVRWSGKERGKRGG